MNDHYRTPSLAGKRDKSCGTDAPVGGAAKHINYLSSITSLIQYERGLCII